jgi:hypothetical protein
MRLPALLPIRKEGVLRIFIALKNPSPWQGYVRLSTQDVSSVGCISAFRRMVDITVKEGKTV